MRSAEKKKLSSVLLCALVLALGCEAPMTSCPEGTEPDGTSCVPIPGADGEVPAPDGGPAMDADTPSMDSGPMPMPDSGPPAPDAGPPPMPDGGTPPPLPDAGPPTCDDPDVYYRDFDMDGQGDPEASVESCDPVPGFVLDSRDCNDTCDACYEGAAEICDGRDNDCDGSTDEGVTTTYYLDADGDSHGNAAISTSGCSAPSGYVTAGDDCDDTCRVCWTGASELCDSEDNDCDGSTDEGVSTTYYLDADGDGRGNPSISTSACSMPSGYVGAADDCDDTCSACWTGAGESCDSRDNDCDGSTDEGVTSTWYLDADGDGRGNPSRTTEACSRPTGHVSNADDCDDSCDVCWTGASEACDSRDNDCNGSTDEGVTTRYYRDADGDTRGDPSTHVDACSAPSGYVTNTNDCNDGCSVCWSGASETCDSRDNNCNGSTDEGVTTRYYPDADGDGHGTASTYVDACSAPSGHVAVGDDCNDACATCYPGRSEVCDGSDNDCDGAVDDGVRSTFYRDADGDGYGNPALWTVACSAPSGMVPDGTDCDDACATCHPGASEICDGLDNDCDVTADEGVTSTFYRDADGDGYGVSGTTTTACSAPSGYAAVSGDCSDTAASVHPGASELCNAVDDDCDGAPDQTFACVRGAAVSCSTSCGSTGTGFCTSACTIPSAASCAEPSETCNYADDDCDGMADEQLFRAGPGRVDAYPSNFARPETVRVGSYLYSFWETAGSIHAWKLDRNGAPVGAATSQVPLGGTANYDVDGNGSWGGLVFAYRDGTAVTGPVVVQRLSTSSLAPTWTHTISVSAYDLQVAVGHYYAFVFTREAAGRIYRRVLSLSTGAEIGSAVEVGQSYRPIDVSDDDEDRQYLAFGDTTFRQLRMVAMQGTGSAPILSTRTADFTENIWDVAIAANWAATGTPPVVGAVALRPTSASGMRIHYVSYTYEPTRVIGVVENASVPNDTSPSRSRLDLEYADGIYLLGAVRTTTYPIPTTGVPRVYQLTPISSSSSTLSVRTIDTGLADAVHESVSIIRLPDSLAEPDRVFYNPPVNGIASMPIGCY